MQVKQIADAWSEELIGQNKELFLTGAARSYDFVVAQYNQTALDLSTVRQERKEYQREVSITILRQELSLKEGDYKRYLDALLNASVDLMLKEARYVKVLERLDELTVDGVWIGLELNGKSILGLAVLTDEQEAVIQAKEALFQTQMNTQEFKAESGLDFLVYSLNLQNELLADNLTLLEEIESEHAADVALLQRMESEIESVPELLVTVKAPNDQTIF